ncbi:MAG: helix-turn-helix domain-containing protein [Gaiellaceae bacterium]
MSPREVFASRLPEIRRTRGVSQAELARLMTDQGRPLDKQAVLRIENGRRGLALDEALAICELLLVAPAHMLTPPEGSDIWLTEGRGLRENEVRNWLLFADPLLITPKGRRTRLRVTLAHAIEVYAQAIVDAKNGGDDAGKKQAIDALEAVILNHNKEMGRIAPEEES